MADYKKTYIGDKAPITQEKLSQMAQNDQYNADLLTSAPRGILAWKKVTSNQVSTDTTGSGVPPTQIIAVTFNTEESRIIRVTFSCRGIQTSVIPNSMYAKIYVDDFQRGGWYKDWQLGGSTSKGLWVSSYTTDLASGPHTAFFALSGNAGAGATYTVPGGATYPIQLLVEDCGSA